MIDCIFCKIIKGEIESAKVYEDAGVIVFMDAYPEGKGHCLVVSKDHYEDMFPLPNELLSSSMLVARRVATAVKRAFNADGILIKQSNGKAAGQDIFHYHMHIVPEYMDINIQPGRPTAGELKTLADKIMEQMSV